MGEGCLGTGKICKVKPAPFYLRVKGRPRQVWPSKSGISMQPKKMFAPNQKSS